MESAAPCANRGRTADVDRQRAPRKPLPASRVMASVISCRNNPPAALPNAIAVQVPHPAHAPAIVSTA